MKATKESKYNVLFNKLIGVNDLPNRLIEIAKDLEYPIFRKNDSYPINPVSYTHLTLPTILLV